MSHGRISTQRAPLLPACSGSAAAAARPPAKCSLRLTAVLAALMLVAAGLVIKSRVYHRSVPAGERLRRIISALDAELLTSVGRFEPAYSTPCWHPPGGGPLSCLPAFFLLSPHQAGAKSLYAALSAHPGIAAAHDAHTQFWSGEHMSMAQYVEALAPSSRLVASEPRRLIGDASEQTLTPYFAQFMRGHRSWSAAVPPCVDSCARNHSDTAGEAFFACAQSCWHLGETAHVEQIRALGLGQREDLTLPLVMRAVYGAAHLPKLVVLLREPSERLHSAFWGYFQYKSRYGDSAEGYAAFVEDQISAFERCVARQQALSGVDGAGGRAGGAFTPAVRRCALLFESLGYAEERVFYHSDQVIRGMYALFLRDWLAVFPRDHVLLVRSEDWFREPRASLARVTAFLGLPGDVATNDALWSTLASAETHRAPNGSLQDPTPAARARTEAFYALHNAALGEMLGLGPVSPWEDLPRPWRPAGGAVEPATGPSSQQQQQQGGGGEQQQQQQQLGEQQQPQGTQHVEEGFQ